MKLVGWQAAFASRLAHSWSEYACERLVGWQGAIAGKP
jgi:hypothetical protein